MKQRAEIGYVASKTVILMLRTVRVKEGQKTFEDVELEALLNEDPCQTQEFLLQYEELSVDPFSSDCNLWE